MHDLAWNTGLTQDYLFHAVTASQPAHTADDLLNPPFN